MSCDRAGRAGPGLRFHPQCVTCDSLAIMSLPCTLCGHKAALEKTSKKCLEAALHVIINSAIFDVHTAVLMINFLWVWLFFD